MLSPRTLLPAASLLLAAGLTGCNSAPLITNDRVTVAPGTPTRINVLANDGDPDGDPLQIKRAWGATKGAVAINGDNTITYTPNAAATGSDIFSYRAKDNRGHTREARVMIDIAPAVAAAPPPAAPPPVLAAPEVIPPPPPPPRAVVRPAPVVTPAPALASVESVLITLHTTDDDKNAEDPIRIIVRRGQEVLADRTVGDGEIWGTDSDRAFEVMLRPPVSVADIGLLTVEVRKPATSASSWAMQVDAQGRLTDGRTLVLLPPTNAIKLGGGDPAERSFTVPPLR